MGLNRIVAARPLLAALVFEALLVPLALVLAALLGVNPLARLAPAAETVLLAILATVPLLGGLALLAVAAGDHFRAIEALVRPVVESLFRGAGHGAPLAVAALAGLGEELLFRGVLQAWLVGLGGPWQGVSLAAVVFGLVHYLSWAYFVLATVMGLYLGALYLVTGDLLLACLVHALYDWIALEYLLWRWRREEQSAPAE
ncbi:MAG: CPBP family intramembrane glutamic endopeptidase [Halofilum sp. (in: g-proteobacteria)]|nr:CPBP family intramembrane glutamic endopeptidase [Halofilum sp. (in: g-proteobacteria)]